MSIHHSLVSCEVTMPSKSSPIGLEFQSKTSVLGSVFDHEVQGEALDLIKGHLTEQTQIPLTRGLQDDPVGWFMPSAGYDPSIENHFVAKVQSFEAGGYEVVITEQNLHELASKMDRPRMGGPREKTEQNENDIISSRNRSKKKVRFLIKSMGCNRLLTLTRRETDPDTFWTVDQWAEAWDRFVRLCKKNGILFDYVAVLEQHKKGNLHMHAAIRIGSVNRKVLWRLWWVVVGHKQGGVDLPPPRYSDNFKNVAGCAKYVSKYITKQTGYTEFNKKRYWSTRHKMPAVRRYVLNAVELAAALRELCGILSLSFMDVMRSAYVFPSREGFPSTGMWFSFESDMAAPVPF